MKFKIKTKKADVVDDKTLKSLKEEPEQEEQEEQVETESKKTASWFSQGFVSAKKEAAKQKARGGWTPEFWLKDGGEAVVRFLTDQPLCIYSHRTRVGDRWAERTCLADTGVKCPLCESGNNKRRFIGVFSIIDRRKESWTNKEGKLIKKQNTLKMWRCGQRILGSLDALIAKRGSLLGYDITVMRAGEGKDSIYNFIPEIPSPLSIEDKQHKPLELMKLLAPKTRQELLAEMGSSSDDEEEVITKF